MTVAGARNGHRHTRRTRSNTSEVTGNVQPDQVGTAQRASSAHGVFHDPSPNGELVPPPSAPLPGVPAMPGDFVPPAADEHLQPDAARGADELG